MKANTYHKSFLSIWVLLILLVPLNDIAAQSVTLSVSPGRGKREISVGDMFYMTIEVEDVDGNPAKPDNVPGAKLLYFDRTGHWSTVTNISGRMTQSIRYTYTVTLKAEKEGQFSFGPIIVNGVKSNVIKYAIGAPMPQNNIPQPNSHSNGQNSDKPEYIGKGDGNLFLRAEVSQSNAYVQQALVYTVKLYSTYDAIKFIGATESPKFDGFVVEESKDISTSLEFETYNDKSYATAIIARYIIFPQQEGTLQIKGNTYTVSVDERDYYHDPFYGSLSVARPKQLNVTPNELTITVKGLPKPVPVDFSGGVGAFGLTSSLPSQNFMTNQAASIVYTIEGTGNLKYITMPNLQNLFPPELEVYSPTSESNISVGKTSVSGNVKYDYSFMPLEAGTFRIPDVKLVYFNPSSGSYETSVASGYTIGVEQGKGSEKSQTNIKNTFNPNLLPVASSLKKEHRPVVFGFLYWLFYIIPLGLLILSYSLYKSYLATHSDLEALKSRQAGKMARKRLKKAEAYMNNNDKENFYDEIIRSLWGYVGDKLKLPTSELSRENISGKLAMKDVPDNVIQEYINLIDDVEYEKYAPSASSNELKMIYSRAIEIMNNLEESFKKSKSVVI